MGLLGRKRFWSQYVPFVLTPGGLLSEVLFPASLMQTSWPIVKAIFPLHLWISFQLSFTSTSTILENTLRLKLVHSFENEVRSFGKRFETTWSCFSPWGKISEPGFWSWRWDYGELFCEWPSGSSCWALEGSGDGEGAYTAAYLSWRGPTISGAGWKGSLGPQYSQCTMLLQARLGQKGTHCLQSTCLGLGFCKRRLGAEGETWIPALPWEKALGLRVEGRRSPVFCAAAGWSLAEMEVEGGSGLLSNTTDFHLSDWIFINFISSFTVCP